MVRLTAIQALRAAAAFAVVLAHAIGDISARAGVELVPGIAAGAAGVDLFFVISGFIMVYSTQGLVGRPGAARIFLARRLARIVPLYWLVTLLYALLQMAQGKWQVIQADWILASLLFWPYPGATGAGLSPFYGIGWTLNFEMMFYIVFAAALSTGRPAPGRIAAFGLVGAVGLSAIIPLPGLLHYWANEIVLDFVLGIAIASVFLRGYRIPKAAGAALVAAGLGGLALSTALGFVAGLPDQPSTAPRSVAWGLPMALITAGIVLASSRRPSAPTAIGHVLSRLGDASYSIYLIHPLVIVTMRPLLPMAIATFGPAPGAIVHLAAVSTLVLVISTVVFAAFERPTTDAILRGRGGRRS